MIRTVARLSIGYTLADFALFTIRPRDGMPIFALMCVVVVIACLAGAALEDEFK